MVNIRPLFPALSVLGLVSFGFGYMYNGYFGPFFVVRMRDSGLSVELISAILSIWYVLGILLSFGAIALISFVSYRYGSIYKLTIVSGFDLVVLSYAMVVLGHLAGVGLWQLQEPKYPTFLASLPGILANYDFALLVLIGVLAANYVRETRRKEISISPANTPL